jgi:hypothetical protein
MISSQLLTVAADGLRELESEADQELRLAQVAVEQPGRIDEMLVAPACEADLWRDAEDEQLYFDASADDEAASGGVAEFERVAGGRGCGHALDDVGGGLGKTAELIPGDAGVYEGMDQRTLEAIFREQRKLPSVRRSGVGEASHHAGQWATGTIVEMAIKNVEFNAEAEREAEFGGGADDVAVGSGRGALRDVDKIVHWQPAFDAPGKGLGGGGGCDKE